MPLHSRLIFNMQMQQNGLSLTAPGTMPSRRSWRPACPVSESDAPNDGACHPTGDRLTRMFYILGLAFRVAEHNAGAHGSVLAWPGQRGIPDEPRGQLQNTRHIPRNRCPPAKLKGSPTDLKSIRRTAHVGIQCVGRLATHRITGVPVGETFLRQGPAAVPIMVFTYQYQWQQPRHCK